MFLKLQHLKNEYWSIFAISLAIRTEIMGSDVQVTYFNFSIVEFKHKLISTVRFPDAGHFEFIGQQTN